jgi:hypothetical protein
MSYTINRYNGTLVATVADGTIDSTLDLKLIGKNYAGYGAVQNENFVYLLENFANTNQPPKPIPGQIWFDSGKSKLKFFDGSKFRTTGGAEIGTTAPTGLTQGDFWYDSGNQQLYAYNGASFTLIGPQAVAGASTTQMRSISVTDTNLTTHAIIQAVDNGQVIFIVSADSDFTLDATINPITGFSTIHQGVTLVYTNDGARPGQTTTSHRFYGTSTNSDKLGGLSASSFVRSDVQPVFASQVSFPDSGFTVGQPQAKLAVANIGVSLTPTITNQLSSTINFQTTVSNITKFPMSLQGPDVLPGVTLASNLGSPTAIWQNIYANYHYGTAQQADALSVSGVYRTSSTSASANTIAARDSSGNLSASVFQGIASSANYADLAEKYLADKTHEVGTVMSVGGSAEVEACQYLSKAIGVVSEKPAYLMNKDLAGGTAIALKGRVPVKVFGPISKGDQLMPWKNGTSTLAYAGAVNVFAIALESSDDAGVKLVEAVVL